MSRPRFSAIIPTAGRPGLERTLASIRDQGDSGRIEVLVIGDSHGEDFRTELEHARALSRIYRCVYAEHDGGSHCYGQAQRNAGMLAASGELLTFLQDDDVYAPGAFNTMDFFDQASRAVPTTDGTTFGPSIPMLYQVKLHHGGGRLVWDNMNVNGPPLHPAIGNIDADCIVVPNVKSKLGRWGIRYLGDFDFITSTLDAWDGQVRWIRQVIAHARPPL